MTEARTSVRAPAACRVCGGTPTIRSHLIPKAFVKEVQSGPKSGEQHLIHHPDNGIKKPSKTGRFEREILCEPCDGKLGRYEDRALELLRQLRQRKLGRKVGSKWKIPERTLRFRVPEDDAFVRFACGILWKYASTACTDPAYLDLGHYLPVLEDICFYDASIPAEVDVFLERDLFQVVAFNDPRDVFYYQTPSMGPRGKALVTQMAWFNVGGFMIYVRMDRSPSDFTPQRCWIAGKQQAYFLVSPRSIEQNVGVVASMQEVRGDLTRLNPKSVM